MSLALRYAARSDIGLVRANNQDSAYAGPHLLVVADGMGGHAGGDVASSIAVARIAPLDDEAHKPDDAMQAFERAVAVAHSELQATARAEPELAGMGTTVTALLRSGNKLVLAHIGDSRAYLLHARELTQVTVDHTLVQYLVNAGKITPEEAEHHPQRSVIMRVLGDIDGDVVLDLSVREACQGDRWLLCSDGLSGVVSHETIAETLASISEPGACAEELIQLALRGGGPDNVTCIVADVVDLNSLPDGAAPVSNAQVVGSAAVDRDRPTRAGDGPAARAAALNRSQDLVDPAGGPGGPGTSDAAVDELDLIDRRRRRRRRTVAAVVVVLLLGGLGVGTYLGYRWTQDQYYVGVARGRVAVYRGIPQTLGPIELSHVVESSGTPIDELPGYVQGRLATPIPADSLDDARDRVQTLVAD